MDVRRRRRSATPRTLDSNSLVTSGGTAGSDHSEPLANELTLATSWADIVDLGELLHSLVAILSTGWILLYSFFFQAIDDMALGLAKLWGGRRDADQESSDDAASSLGGMMPLAALEGFKQNSKRRRRKESDARSRGSHYPGMVNLSGTLCYMNSVLQAFASLASLWSHLERIIALAVEYDVPTPVTDTLLEVLQDLNTPHHRPPPALRPRALLTALRTLPAIQRLLGTREQQDAHELFLVLAEAVSDESLRVAAEVARSKGLGEVLSLQGYAAGKYAAVPAGEQDVGGSGRKGTEKHGDGAKRARMRGLAQPWEGLMARRRTCRVCGWCEAIRMDTLGGMELSLPQSGDVNLEACIAQYLSAEILTDVTCEMCSLRKTHAYYQAELDRLNVTSASSSSSAPASNGIHPRTASGSFAALEDLPKGRAPTAPSTEMTSARKRRAKEARRVEVRLRQMLESGSVQSFGEPNLPAIGPSGSSIPLKWQTVRTDSVREGIITRPPQTLRLHLIRSEYTPYGALLKKSARVAFPLVLDLTRFVARGVWEEKGSAGVSVLGALAERANGDVGQIVPQRRVLYRLESVILHYGYTHSAGHYVCIRRIPAQSAEQSATPDQSPEFDKPSRATKTCPDGCTCDSCMYFGQVRGENGEPEMIPGKGWLRVSDDEVEEVGNEALVECRSQVVMLFYERVAEFEGVQAKGGGMGRDQPEENGREEAVGSDHGRYRGHEENTEGRRTPSFSE